MSVIEGNIIIDESYLVEQGICKDHLEGMKQETVQCDSDYHYYYEMVDTEEDILVPVKKIKGLTGSKGEANRSWFDHITNKAGNLSWARLNNLRRSLEEQGLESFRQSFKDPGYQVKLIHYDKEDSYYVGSDGNHHTVWAKITNAPSICARVSRYKFNPLKWMNYQSIREMEAKFQRTLKQYNLEFDAEQYWMEADFGYIQVNDWPILYFECPVIFDYGNESKVHTVLQEYEKVFNQLEQIVRLHKKWGFVSDIKKRVLLLKALQLFLNEERQGVYNMLLDLYKAGWHEKYRG
ncbi:hypothetical protein GCM10011571_35500 [Marinithermofilum abyssi]|uniref:Uncharacterized protein n=1 Tax=Marinithermofilum abyssi TaxID=1571185 RepID=A0A8J2VL38_9BACL|nr:hypothetical protein [Marinithermofilum abyssi]GGE30194.1 hypothetical protein GCM10011571_35500 [Marinithermofilum abyssi]